MLVGTKFVRDPSYVPAFKPEVRAYGILIDHDMPCYVCFKAPAVLTKGEFRPCHSCGREGWLMLQTTAGQRWALRAWAWLTAPSTRVSAALIVTVGGFSVIGLLFGR